MKTKVIVMYEAPLDMEMDKKITGLLEGIGAKWYAQGTNIYEKEREICFDLEI